MIENKNLDALFIALDRQIAVSGGGPIALVVCGGTALAALDRGGYHVDDLFKLSPTDAELLNAGRWVLTQDVSSGFREILLSFLKKHGHDKLAATIQRNAAG